MSDFNPREYREQVAKPYGSEISLRAVFLSRVYGLMSIGLALTALIAFFVAGSPELVRTIVMNKMLFWAMIIAEFGIVVWLSAAIEKMSASTATAGFIAYSVLNGVTFAVIFLAYTAASIASTFFICAGSFAALSAFGALTKKDLSGVGNFCLIGLFGLVIATVVNIFLQNSLASYIMAYIGVFIFAGLTAYDTQKIKQMAEMQFDGESARKYAVIGALELYLDFINLFLFLLRIFGNRR